MVCMHAGVFLWRGHFSSGYNLFYNSLYISLFFILCWVKVFSWWNSCAISHAYHWSWSALVFLLIRTGHLYCHVYWAWFSTRQSPACIYFTGIIDKLIYIYTEKEIGKCMHVQQRKYFYKRPGARGKLSHAMCCDNCLGEDNVMRIYIYAWHVCSTLLLYACILHIDLVFFSHSQMLPVHFLPLIGALFC